MICLIEMILKSKHNFVLQKPLGLWNGMKLNVLHSLNFINNDSISITSNRISIVYDMTLY